MIVNGYLICECGKKLMLIRPGDTVNGTAYCHVCKALYSIVAANGRLFEMKRIEL